QSPTQPRRGAPHTMDIALAFGTLDAEGSYTGTGAEARALSQAMMKAFTAFARRGNPNGTGVPAWPAYRLPGRTTMVWDRKSAAVADPRGWERELFARVPYVQPGT
ncbi:MAG TPA: carboxylesterase family protein, partial [Allosphingosinicella sp.]